MVTTNESPRAERAGMPPIDRSGAPPLALWRTAPPCAVTAREVAKLDRLVGGGAPHDPATAVAAAMGLLRADGLASRHADLVMSRLVVLAMCGDATAPVVLAHALTRLARRRPDACCLRDLASQWARRSGAASVPAPPPTGH